MKQRTEGEAHSSGKSESSSHSESPRSMPHDAALGTLQAQPDRINQF